MIKISEEKYSKTQLILNDHYLNLLFEIQGMIQNAYINIDNQGFLNVKITKNYINDIKRESEIISQKLLKESIKQLISVIENAPVKNAEMNSLLQDLSNFFNLENIPILKRICLEFDENILKLILNPDNFEEALIKGNE